MHLGDLDKCHEVTDSEQGGYHFKRGQKGNKGRVNHGMIMQLLGHSQDCEQGDCTEICPGRKRMAIKQSSSNIQQSNEKSEHDLKGCRVGPQRISSLSQLSLTDRQQQAVDIRNGQLLTELRQKFGKKTAMTVFPPPLPLYTSISQPWQR